MRNEIWRDVENKWQIKSPPVRAAPGGGREVVVGIFRGGGLLMPLRAIQIVSNVKIEATPPT